MYVTSTALYQHLQSCMSQVQLCTSIYSHVCHTARSVPAPTVTYVTLPGLYENPQSCISHVRVCTSTHSHACHTSWSVPAPAVTYVTLAGLYQNPVMYITHPGLYQHPQSRMSLFQVCTTTHIHVSYMRHICYTQVSVLAPTVI